MADDTILPFSFPAVNKAKSKTFTRMSAKALNDRRRIAPIWQQK
jgi:hypothetical protein